MCVCVCEGVCVCVCVCVHTQQVKNVTENMFMFMLWFCASA